MDACSLCLPVHVVCVFIFVLFQKSVSTPDISRFGRFELRDSARLVAVGVVLGTVARDSYRVPLQEGMEGAVRKWGAKVWMPRELQEIVLDYVTAVL